MDEQQIIDGLKPVCLCRNIKKRVFLRHIAEGKRSLEQLRAATGAGSGPCGGRRCTPKILALLDGYGR